MRDAQRPGEEGGDWIEPAGGPTPQSAHTSLKTRPQSKNVNSVTYVTVGACQWQITGV